MSLKHDTKSVSSSKGRSVTGRPFFIDALLLLAVSALFFYVLQQRIYLIGDGREYACSAVLWGKDFRPWHSEADVRACIQQILPGDPFGAVGWTPLRGDLESIHFWLLPLLVAPFAAVTSPLPAWPLFHWALSAFAVVWIRRRAGPWFAVGVVIVLGTSPLIYWANKAHSEFFICVLLMLAFVEVWCGNLLWATLWISIASTQQTTVAVPALLCGAAWILLRGRLPREPLWLLAAITGVLALSPVYYLLRIGQPTVLGASVHTSLLSAHRAYSLLVDPDIGLIAAWPQGLLLCALALLTLRDVRVQRVLAAAILFVAVEPLVVCMQGSWNSGGTVFIQRYALYLLVAFAAVAVAGVVASRWRTPVFAAVTVIALAGHFWRTLPIFHVDQPENYMTRSDVGRWLYDNHPGWYDPQPDVFIERIINQELPDPPYPVPPDVWAFGNYACTKLYLVKPAEQLQTLSNPADPVGCRKPNDSREVLRALIEGRMEPTSRGYVNVQP